MPPEAISLALAASIYPPALAAVIALGRGVEVRLRVVLLVIAAYLTSLVTGSLMLLLFDELHASRAQLIAPCAALYILGGVVLLWLARRIHHAPPRRPRQAPGPSRTERYLQSRRLVLALGVVLYVVPSPIYVGAVKAIADVHTSAGQELIYLVQLLAIMLWIIELPMLMLLAFPERSVGALERTNAWFAGHGRMLLALLSAVLGAYLILLGVIQLAA